MITTPGHGAYPSGHATQAFMLARLLDGLLGLSIHAPSKALQLYRQASRIATNRVVAGVHFPVDSVAGRLLGHVIAEYVLALLNVSDVPNVPSVQPIARSFDASGVDGKRLDLDIALHTIDTQPTVSMGYTIGNAVSMSATAPRPVLAKLYALGADERKALRP